MSWDLGRVCSVITGSSEARLGPASWHTAELSPYRQLIQYARYVQVGGGFSVLMVAKKGKCRKV